uniref:Bestrophin homolog n=1 Tax=Macrostomum lignano TaxID=282301 RepID=A0A1I8GFA3_9PLAT
MYLSIPWMNRLATFAQAFITSSPEEAETARQIRLNLMRHVNLGWILGLSQICRKLQVYFSEGKVQQRGSLWRIWPGKALPVRSFLNCINSSSEARAHFGKLATDSEIEAMAEIEQQYCAKYGRAYCPEYWLPMQWATRICKQAMLHGYCDV